MRGLYSSKTEIRHKIFTEIARMAYEEQSPEEVLEGCNLQRQYFSGASSRW